MGDLRDGVFNETDHALPDVEVHVEWYDAGGRELDSGDALMEYTMSETGIAPGRLAKFRFRSSTVLDAKNFMQVSQELLHSSKVDLEITSEGRKLAYAPGSGWEHLRNPPMRPATPDEIAAIKRQEQAAKVAEANAAAEAAATDEAMMNRVIESYVNRPRADAPSGIDNPVEQERSSDGIDTQLSEEAATTPRKERTRSPKAVGSSKRTTAEEPSVVPDRRALRVTIDRLQTLRQTIAFDSLDHAGSGGGCADDSEGSWSRLRGSAIRRLADLTRVSSPGSDRPIRPEDVRDGWGSDFRFIATAGCNSSFCLWSAGPDRAFDAADLQAATRSRVKDDILLFSEQGNDRWVNRPHDN